MIRARRYRMSMKHEAYPWRRLFYKSKREAMNEGKRWSLTQRDFFAIVMSPCFYCGCDPAQPISRRIGVDRVKYTGERFVNGVDRIDSKYGYTPPNVVPCCWQCNEIKSNYTVGEFLCHITKMLPALIKLHTENLTLKRLKGVRPSLVKQLESTAKTIPSYIVDLFR